MRFLLSYLAIFLMVLGLAQAVPKKKKGGEVNLDEKITFGWCRTWDNPEDCGQRELDHSRCYDLKTLDPYLNDNIETVSVKGGRCVMWSKENCNGAHTAMFVGNNIFVNHLCPRYDWQRKATSVKCCGGDPNALWCADPGNVPKCTG